MKTENTTTASYQVVADRHGAVEFSYAWSREEAEQQKARMTRTCVCGEVHAVEIRERGNFVPDYDEE